VVGGISALWGDQLATSNLLVGAGKRTVKDFGGSLYYWTSSDG